MSSNVGGYLSLHIVKCLKWNPKKQKGHTKLQTPPHTKITNIQHIPIAFLMLWYRTLRFQKNHYRQHIQIKTLKKTTIYPFMHNLHHPLRSPMRDLAILQIYKCFQAKLIGHSKPPAPSPIISSKHPCKPTKTSPKKWAMRLPPHKFTYNKKFNQFPLQ